MTLREIVTALRQTYCGNIGAEYMYISDPAQKRWIQQRLESMRSTPAFTAEEKLHILERVTAAEGLERYLHTKYVGQKRFSLEGGETFIAAMDELIQRAGATGVRRDRHRHGAPRPAQRAGQHARQDAEGTVRRVRGQVRLRPAGGRRQVPHRILERHLDAGRPGAPVARLQPVAPRDRQPGRRGLGARAPGAARRRGRATRCCRCWCTATPPSPARASSWKRSTSRRPAATAPAARCTSSSTTRSASRHPTRATRVRRSTAPTS